MSVVLHNITQLVVRVETAQDLGLLKCLIGMGKCSFLRHGRQEWNPATAAAAAAAAAAASAAPLTRATPVVAVWCVHTSPMVWCPTTLTNDSVFIYRL